MTPEFPFIPPRPFPTYDALSRSSHKFISVLVSSGFANFSQASQSCHLPFRQAAGFCATSASSSVRGLWALELRSGRSYERGFESHPLRHKVFENSILDGATAIGMKKHIRPQTNHAMHDLSKALSRSALFTNLPSEGT